MIPLRDSVHASRRPVITYALVAANVYVFLYQVTLGPALEPFIYTYGFIPAQFFRLGQADPWNVGRFLPLFTSMFLHGGLAHLLGNMIYLWIFGDNVEDRLRHERYTVFYLLSGIGASLAHAYLHPTSTIPAVGASGAISGVLGGYLFLFPHAYVLTLVPIAFVFVHIIQIPAVVYPGFWFFIQLFGGLLGHFTGGMAGGVAWWAHVGGFAAGLVLTPLMHRRRSEQEGWADKCYPW